MRIPSGVTDQYLYFVAVDATDYVSRETGLSSFTVYRSRNGGAAAAMTTPTINETDATNMPGVYELLLDEDMTIDAGDDTQEMAFHITHAGMAPVTRTIELYRPKITAGETLTVASGLASANAIQISGDATAADNLEADYDGTGYNKSASTVGTVTTLTGHTPQTGDSYARLGAPAGASVSADIAANQTDLNSILEDTGTTIPALFPASFNTLTVSGGYLEVDLKAIHGTQILEVTAGRLAGNFTTFFANGNAATSATLDDVSDILTDTGTTLPATLTAIQGATFNTATDSLEALRNRGDAAWITATGFSTHSAADVRTEMDANSTQLAGIIEDTGTTIPALFPSGFSTVVINAGAVDSLMQGILNTTFTESSAGRMAGNMQTFYDNANAATSQTVDDVGGGTGLDAAGVRAAIGMASANLDTQLAAIVEDTGTTIPNLISGITTSASPNLLQTTTIATLSSQTSFTLTAGSADDDAYNNRTAIVTDAATSTQKAVGFISDYVGSTRTVTLREDPGVFTMAAGDTISIVVAGSGTKDNDTDIDTLISRTSAGVTVNTVVGSDGTLTVIAGDTYDGSSNEKLTWTVSKDYTGNTITLVLYDKESPTTIYARKTGAVDSATVVSVSMDATFDTDPTYTGCPASAAIGYALISTDGDGDDETIQRGTMYIYNRGTVA